MNVPSSRQLVTLKFTNGRGESVDMREEKAQNVIDSIKLNSRDDDDLNMTTSEFTTSSTLIGPHNGRTRPPIGKQQTDIYLLMENLIAFSKRSEKLVLMRNNIVADDFMHVFLVPKCWWDLWASQREDSLDIRLGPINNWSFVDRIVKEKGEEGTTHLANSLTHSSLSDSDQTMEQDMDDIGNSDIKNDSRYQLREDILSDDFRIVTYEAWTTLTAWYGGSPPLPALLFNLTNHVNNGNIVTPIKTRKYTETTAVMAEETGASSDDRKGSIGKLETNGSSHKNIVEMEIDKTDDNDDNDDNDNKEHYDNMNHNFNPEHLRPLIPISMQEVLDFIQLGPKNETLPSFTTPPQLSVNVIEDIVSVRTLSTVIACEPTSDCGGFVAKEILDQGDGCYRHHVIML